MDIRLTRRTALASLAALPGLAVLSVPTHAKGARPDAMREADRLAIKAMAGNYKVTFDMRETTSFRADYTPIEPKLSGGHEVVRVIADTDEFISLQHLLVAEINDKSFIIKHWRQDWTYEPREVLVYVGLNRWALEKVGRDERKGAWAQTVWQTDDSPRYGGVARWEHAAGQSIWVSNVTLRPLARRDATRHPVYDHYAGVNRHALTPTGWVHEQDNAKRGRVGDDVVTFVHENVTNTYERFEDYDVAAADKYWAATSAYWAEVRAAWDAQIKARKGIYVTEEAENGSLTGPTLMGLADAIAAGDKVPSAAIAEARLAIEAETAKA